MKDEILNLWAAGRGARWIARQVGRNPSNVWRAIYRARAAGDPRAISHAHLAAGEDGWRARYKVIHKGGKIAGWSFT